MKNATPRGRLLGTIRYCHSHKLCLDLRSQCNMLHLTHISVMMSHKTNTLSIHVYILCLQHVAPGWSAIYVHKWSNDKLQNTRVALYRDASFKKNKFPEFRPFCLKCLNFKNRKCSFLGHFLEMLTFVACIPAVTSLHKFGWNKLKDSRSPFFMYIIDIASSERTNKVIHCNPQGHSSVTPICLYNHIMTFGVL